MGGDATPAAADGAGCVPNNKTGTVWTATMHIFCAVVGAGVLSLPRSLAWLGWVAGPICLVIFFIIALWTSRMLADVYYVNGVEHARYHHAILHIVGERGATVATVFQVLTLVLVDIAYTVTGAASMQTIAREIGSSWTNNWQLTLLFGGLELFFSQLPSLESVWWVSGAGTLSSLTYTTITLILGLVYSGNRLGTVGGISASTASKTWGVLSALGSFAFAFSFAQILLEIQDTLRQPPSCVPTMKTAINISEITAFCYYFAVSVTSYAALGNDVAGDVLSGYEQAPAWTLTFANIAVAIHMITAFQVLAQPIFDMIESRIKAYVLRRRAGSADKAAEAEGGARVTKASLASDTSFVSRCELDVEGSTTRAAISMRLSTVSCIRLSAAGLSVVNSAPIPDLLPPESEVRPDSKAAASFRHQRHQQEGGHANDCPCQFCNRAGTDATTPAGRALSVLAVRRSSMYALTTGATNEHVPLNEAHYYLPWWQRLIIRSSYVGLVTLISALMPFFTAIVGLVGSLTFWPLCIAFPMIMWRKVYQPRGAKLKAMWAVGITMLLVSLAALVASVESIIVSWQTFTFFGS